MHFDWDLARSILLKVENNPEATGRTPYYLGIPGRSDEEVSYHLSILTERGLLVAQDMGDPDELTWYPLRLTAAGHDFVDTFRQSTLWEKAKAYVKENCGDLSMEALKTVGTALITKSLGG